MELDMNSNSRNRMNSLNWNIKQSGRIGKLKSFEKLQNADKLLNSSTTGENHLLKCDACSVLNKFMLWILLKMIILHPTFQVLGPIVFRVDSKYLLDASSGKDGSHMEDVIYSLSYSLRLLRSGKVVAWYSPKRKEGMVELRVFEF